MTSLRIICELVGLAYMLALTFIIFLKYKEEKDMAAVYVALIIKGRRTYSSVPKSIKPQVKEMLIDLELEYLIDEE